MRFSSITALTLLAIATASDAQGQQQSTNRIRRVVVAVAATNDEWTTTGLTVNKDDRLIISADGLIKVGAMTGEVDATGARPNSSSSTGYGILEYKVGVGAGQPSGKFGLRVADSRDELKFRVKDSRYDDNSGSFDVDVTVIPQAALPDPTRVGDPPEQTPVSELATEVGRALVTEMKSFLRNMVAVQEAHFADHSRYTNKLADLKMQLPTDVTLKTLSIVPAGSWSAIVTHSKLPRMECAIAVGGKNPVAASAGEGEPVCR